LQDVIVDLNVSLAAERRGHDVHVGKMGLVAGQTRVLQGETCSIGADALAERHLPLIGLFWYLLVKLNRRDREIGVGRPVRQVYPGRQGADRGAVRLVSFTERRHNADPGDPDIAPVGSHCAL
jgi:hypothetical protein